MKETITCPICERSVELSGLGTRFGTGDKIMSIHLTAASRNLPISVACMGSDRTLCEAEALKHMKAALSPETRARVTLEVMRIEAEIDKAEEAPATIHDVNRAESDVRSRLALKSLQKEDGHNEG